MLLIVTKEQARGQVPTALKVDAVVQHQRSLCVARLRCVPLGVQSVQKSADGSYLEPLVTQPIRPFTGRCVPERAHARKKNTCTNKRTGTKLLVVFVQILFVVFAACLQLRVQPTNEQHAFIGELTTTVASLWFSIGPRKFR